MRSFLNVFFSLSPGCLDQGNLPLSLTNGTPGSLPLALTNGTPGNLPPALTNGTPGDLPLAPANGTLSGGARNLRIALGLLCGLFLGGCFQTKGLVFLQKDALEKALLQTPVPTELKELSAKKEEELRKMPDSQRTLGGFCDDPVIAGQMMSLRLLQPACLRQLQQAQNEASRMERINGALLAGALVASAGIIAGGALPPDSEIRLWLMVGAGSVALGFAAGWLFSGTERKFLAEAYKARTIDTYLWLLRARLRTRVCLAPSQKDALLAMRSLLQEAHETCSFSGDLATRPALRR